jgi:hypothetical protein
LGRSAGNVGVEETGVPAGVEDTGVLDVGVLATGVVDAGVVASGVVALGVVGAGAEHPTSRATRRSAASLMRRQPPGSV